MFKQQNEQHEEQLTINSDNNENFQLSSNTQQNLNQTADSLPKSKTLMNLMKTTCPNYFSIPISNRKRILRFLCDNGWIDI